MKNDDYEPLCGAVQAFDAFIDAVWGLACTVDGTDDPNPAVLADVDELITMSSDAVIHLTTRARHTRLRMLWKDFLAKHASTPTEPVAPAPTEGLVN